MESIYTPPSQFSGEYSKAMECINMIVLEAINTGFGTVGPQDYKWTNVVIDEETGDVMDLKSYWDNQNTRKRGHKPRRMSMDACSKDMEETKMIPNK